MEFWEIDRRDICAIEDFRDTLRPTLKNMDTRITEMEVMLCFISMIRKSKNEITTDELLEVLARVCTDYWNELKEVFEYIEEGGKLDTAVKAVINGREGESK